MPTDNLYGGSRQASAVGRAGRPEQHSTPEKEKSSTAHLSPLPGTFQTPGPCSQSSPLAPAPAQRAQQRWCRRVKSTASHHKMDVRLKLAVQRPFHAVPFPCRVDTPRSPKPYTHADAQPSKDAHGHWRYQLRSHGCITSGASLPGLVSFPACAAGVAAAAASCAAGRV